MTSIKVIFVAVFIISSCILKAQVAITTNGGSANSSAMLDVGSTDKGMLIPRMTQVQRNAIVVDATRTGLLVYQTDNTPGFYYFNGTYWVALAQVSTTRYVGELYGGGVVFRVDHTGQHGLIVSIVDINTSKTWSNVGSVGIGSAARSDWNGFGNSAAIVTQTGHLNSAAKICLDYVNSNYGTGQHSNWYLPSRCELNDLWNNLGAVQKALEGDGNSSTTPLGQNKYWSSTEYNNNSAWYFTFHTGDMATNTKNISNYVRAVRAF